jgi:hypothetical protein
MGYREFMGYQEFMGYREFMGYQEFMGYREFIGGQMCMPPSTGSAAPVTNELSELAR